ncbi:pickpocket protein 28-like [Diabrotica virgifera virgifera]|uniref:Pickpocket protein 28-like n=1 Tax=Diabrotica virgifera virgifera TaxID=50390 RepID=A0ABM5KW37_DIAVI|nr:pickpocket protein 28-like [Diabrotica virgifera virgifera]
MTEKQEKPFCKSVRNYFKEYCRSTSIHGFQYFGENRSYLERTWWFIVFAIALSSCIYAILQVYDKWVRSPVIVSFATQETPIYSIPFPAVTICPESKSNQEVYSHTDMVKKFANNRSLTTKERNNVKYMSLVCDLVGYIKLPDSDYVDENIYSVLSSLNSDYPLFECYYMNKRYNCKDIFVPIYTDEGICYSFNILDRSEVFKDIVQHNLDSHQTSQYSDNQWSIEKGYAEDAGLEAYPRRALLSGISNALTVRFVTMFNVVDKSGKSGFQGFKVSLHLPSRIPRPSQEYFRIPDNQAVMAAVSPNMIKTSDSLTNYDVRKRKCHFSYERNLKFFRVYTLLNCKMECLTNFTLQYCGCVGFYMPRENSTKICGLAKHACMKKAESILQLLNLRQLRNLDEAKAKELDQIKMDCNCLPMCSDLSYNTESSQCEWDWISALFAPIENITDLPLDTSIITSSQLVVFFKRSDFIFSERNELYGPLDFLANFGGLLGLFTGFSLLSLMEIVYFLSLRIVFNRRMYGYWAGRDN